MKINIKYIDFIPTNNGFTFVNGLAVRPLKYRCGIFLKCEVLIKFAGKVSNYTKVIKIFGRESVVGITLYNPLGIKPLRIKQRTLNVLMRKIFKCYKSDYHEEGMLVGSGGSALGRQIMHKPKHIDYDYKSFSY